MKGENRKSGRSQMVKGLERPQRSPWVAVKLFTGHPNLLTITAFLHLKMSYVYGATHPSTRAWL